MAISKVLLSGSTNGLPINIAATNSASANTVHTASSVCIDEIWLWAYNASTGDVVLSIEHGSTAFPYSQSITAQSGLYLCSPGLCVSSAAVVKAFSTLSSAIQVLGYVNRIAS